MRQRFAIGLVVAAMMMCAQAQPARVSAQSPAAAPEITPNNYADEKSWLCRPGRQDACAVDLTTTVVSADGKLTREAWTPAKAPAIDCFYVYPTVSTDQSPFSDMSPDPAEQNVVLQQFARFGSVCRLFAPMYRQVTLAGLRKLLGAGSRIAETLESGPQLTDVRDAWRSYLERDNQGRGVVLIGHSQGAYVLAELIRQEIDGKPAQSKLVSALLLGTTVSVARGSDVGGSFAKVPLCRSASQTGCVITYATYRSTLPPPADALFGRQSDPKLQAACTNPAALGGGSGELKAYLSSGGRTITGGGAKRVWTTPDQPIETPWVAVPGLLTARCATNEHATFLEITVHGNPADPRADDISGDLGAPGQPVASWGLHLVDVNLTIGNLLDIVGQQAQAYAKRR